MSAEAIAAHQQESLAILASLHLGPRLRSKAAIFAEIERKKKAKANHTTAHDASSPVPYIDDMLYDSSGAASSHDIHGAPSFHDPALLMAAFDAAQRPDHTDVRARDVNTIYKQVMTSIESSQSINDLNDIMHNIYYAFVSVHHVRKRSDSYPKFASYNEQEAMEMVDSHIFSYVLFVHWIMMQINSKYDTTKAAFLRAVSKEPGKKHEYYIQLINVTINSLFSSDEGANILNIIGLAHVEHPDVLGFDLLSKYLFRRQVIIETTK